MTLLFKSKLALGGLVLVGGLLAGCAGDPPAAQMDVAKLAVNNAVSANATQFAPMDMQSAQENLRKARVVLEEENYEQAREYAERAEWDARVAERKSQVEKARIVDPNVIITQPVTKPAPINY